MPKHIFFGTASQALGQPSDYPSANVFYQWSIPNKYGLNNLNQMEKTHQNKSGCETSVHLLRVFVCFATKRLVRMHHIGPRSYRISEKVSIIGAH